MFSITTIELSTSIPTPRASPARDIILILTPVKYIAAIAPIRLTGIDKATTIVGFISFKKISNTIIASIPPEIILSIMESVIISI